MKKITCDTHTHTLYSRHAYSTIEENVRAAAEQGLELLASTDHFGCMLYPGNDIRDFQYLYNQDMWPRQWHGVKLLRGVEADIVDLEGHLYGHGVSLLYSMLGEKFEQPEELSQRIINRQDYVIASIHKRSFTEGATIGQTTDMYCRAMEQPKVFILGHVGRACVPFDLDTVLLHAKQTGRLIEINEHSFDKTGKAIDNCRNIAVRCAELGVSVSLGTDAHVSCFIGKFDHCLEMLEEIHFPEELIASRDAKTYLKALDKAGIYSEA
ncbi:MAG: phosphatase [Lachnospiraceae bacterium]|nr:phosphatase [Lachnospiraceae bacterium]